MPKINKPSLNNIQTLVVSLVVSMVMSFVLSFFQRGVLDEILNLIESVSEGFPSCSCLGKRITTSINKNCAHIT